MSSPSSLAALLAALPPERRDHVVAQLSCDEQAQVAYLWDVWARPNQLLPDTCECHGGNWATWLILSGRGWGKTRTGAETCCSWAADGRYPIILLAGATDDDVRDTMIEGESGILAVSPPWFKPAYRPSKKRVEWPNGAIGICRSAEKPGKFRGPQYFKAWLDELAAWRYPEAWDQIQFGLRLGDSPQAVVTTTPRPTPLVRAVLKDPTTHVTRGTTYENAANLAGRFLERVRTKYEGTRLGRQELHAEVLDDNPGALWKRGQIDAGRIQSCPELERIGIGVDPAVTAHKNSDETGIVAAGVAMCGCKGKPELHAFVLDDFSGIYTPDQWAQKVVSAYRNRKADIIVAEINKGGDLVAANIRTADQNAPVTTVHASRGKYTRAEPVAALYEQGKVHHVGMLATLEDQLCDWDPSQSDSPDRLDALVWVLSELMLEDAAGSYDGMPKKRMPSRRM